MLEKSGVLREAQDALIAGLVTPTVADDVGLTPRELALLVYAEQLTHAPSTTRAPSSPTSRS